jgi:hypothetical protein
MLCLAGVNAETAAAPSTTRITARMIARFVVIGAAAHRSFG